MNTTQIDFCKKHNLTEGQFFGSEKIEGSLYLSSLTSIPEGFNPTVGGNLYLYSLKNIPEGFNPTVGGTLALYSLKSIPEGFNPIVGGDLYLNSLTSIPKNVKFENVKGKVGIPSFEILSYQRQESKKYVESNKNLNNFFKKK